MTPNQLSDAMVSVSTDDLPQVVVRHLLIDKCLNTYVSVDDPVQLAAASTQQPVTQGDAAVEGDESEGDVCCMRLCIGLDESKGNWIGQLKLMDTTAIADGFISAKDSWDNADLAHCTVVIPGVGLRLALTFSCPLGAPARYAEKHAECIPFECEGTGGMRRLTSADPGLSEAPLLELGRPVFIWNGGEKPTAEELFWDSVDKIYAGCPPGSGNELENASVDGPASGKTPSDNKAQGVFEKLLDKTPLIARRRARSLASPPESQPAPQAVKVPDSLPPIATSSSTKPARKVSTSQSIPNAMDLPFKPPLLAGRHVVNQRRPRPSKLNRSVSFADLTAEDARTGGNNPRERRATNDSGRAEQSTVATPPLESLLEKEKIDSSLSEAKLCSNPDTDRLSSPFAVAYHKGDEQVDWGTANSADTVIHVLPQAHRDSMGSSSLEASIAVDTNGPKQEPTPPESFSDKADTNSTSQFGTTNRVALPQSTTSHLNLLSPVSPPDPDVIEAHQLAQLARMYKYNNARPRPQMFLSITSNENAIESCSPAEILNPKSLSDVEASSKSNLEPEETPAKAVEKPTIDEPTEQDEDPFKPQRVIRGGFNGICYSKQQELSDYAHRVNSSMSWFRFPPMQISEEFLPKGIKQYDWDRWREQDSWVDGVHL